MKTSRVVCPLVFVGVGALLRLVALGRVSLWMDEGFTYSMASVPLSAIPHSLLGIEKHPPLYYVLAHAALALGRGEVMLRLPAALAGTLTVLAAWWLGRVAYGPREGWVAAGLLAVGGMHVLMSRDARGYSLAALFLTLATGCWLLLLRAQASASPPSRLPRGPLAGYLAAAIAAVYTHYLSFLVLAIHSIAALIRTRDRRWLAIPLGTAAAFAPWIPVVLAQARTPSPGHHPAHWRDFADVFFAQAAGFTLNFPSFARYHLPPLTAWYFVALLAAGVALHAMVEPPFSPWGGWSSAGQRIPTLQPKGGEFRAVGLLLGAVFLGFVAGLVLISMATGVGVFETKYTVLVNPVFWTLCARRIATTRPRLLAAALVVFFPALNLTSDYNLLTQPEWHQQNVRAAAGILAREARADDLVLLESDWAAPALSFYWPLRDVVPLAARDVAAFAPDRIPRGRRVWLVRISASLADPGDRVKRLLDARRPVLKEWRLPRRNPSFNVYLTLYGPSL